MKFKVNPSSSKGIAAAVALEYDSEKDKSPRVTAKGVGKIAESIIHLAKENGIPMRADPDLLALLYPLELEEEIPPKLYGVVAELLAYIYKVNEKMKE